MLPGFPTRLLKEVGTRFRERILKDLHNRIPWKTLEPDFLVLEQALYY